MKFSGKNALILILICILIIFVFVLSFKAVNKRANETQYLSAISWLNAEINEKLNSFYQIKGYYPENSSLLEIDFPGDNATPEMLNRFEYSKNDKSYTLLCTFEYDGDIYEYKRKGLNGEVVFVETKVNGVIVQTHNK